MINKFKFCKLKKEYCENKEESDILYIIKEENNDKVYIEPMFSKLSIPPIELVRKKHLILYHTFKI